MGATGEDVQLSTAARLLVPYQIECKNKASTATHTWYAQAAEHGDHEPLLVIKQNHDIPLAVVSLTHFMDLINKTK